MERRDFLKGSAIAAAGVGALSLATPAIAQEKRELKMVTTWPKNFPGLGTGAQRFADRVTNASDGRITIKVFAAGELVPPFESFDAVSQGTADLYHGADYYWQGKSKAYNFFCAVPMGFTANEMDAWIQFGGGQELWDELGADFNIKGLPCGNTGVQMGGWFNKEINSLEDMKGLKMRMPGLGGETLRQLGATAQSLPGGEIFPALQSGAIDATEWVGPWNDEAFGFYKITKYYYYPGFHEPGSMLAAGFNKDVWESFSDNDKALLTACALAENNAMYAEFNANNGAALTRLVNEHGVQLREFSDDVFNAIAKSGADVVAGTANDGGITKKVYDSYSKFRDDVVGWTTLADTAYSNARAKAEGRG